LPKPDVAEMVVAGGVPSFRSAISASDFGASDPGLVVKLVEEPATGLETKEPGASPNPPPIVASWNPERSPRAKAKGPMTHPLTFTPRDELVAAMEVRGESTLPSSRAGGFAFQIRDVILDSESLEPPSSRGRKILLPAAGPVTIPDFLGKALEAIDDPPELWEPGGGPPGFARAHEKRLAWNPSTGPALGRPASAAPSVSLVLAPEPSTAMLLAAGLALLAASRRPRSGLGAVAGQGKHPRV